MIVLFFLLIFLLGCEDLTVSSGGDSGSGSETVSVTGVLINDKGKLLKSAKVDLYSLQGDSLAWEDSIRTNSNGLYEFTTLEKGVYQLNAHYTKEKDTLSLLLKEFPILSSQTYFSHRMTPPGGLKGKVISPTKVYKAVLHKTQYAAEVDNQGVFHFDGIPEGRYDLCFYEIKGEGDCNNFYKVSVRSGETVQSSFVKSESVYEGVYQDVQKWGSSKKVWIDASSSGLDLQENLYNYPFLLRLNYRNIGQDFVRGEDKPFIVLSQSGQLLSHMVSRWDEVNGEVDLWVRLDTLRKQNKEQYITLHWNSRENSSVVHQERVFSTSKGFVGAWSFEEQQIYRDHTDNSVHGVGIGTIFNEEAGISGKSVRMGSDSAHIEFPKQALFNFFSAFTVSLWVNISNFGKPQATIIAKGDDHWRMMRGGWKGDKQTFKFHMDKDNKSSHGRGGSSIGLDALTPLNDGKWHHLTIQYDGQYLMVFVDGKKEGSLAYTDGFFTSSAPLWIGSNYHAPHLEFRGKIDEVRVSRTYRSPNWILMDYKTQLPNTNWIRITNE